MVNLFKNKKGAISHIEVMISFVLFVTFVIFLFIILNPFKPQVNDEILDFIYTKIEEQVMAEVSIVSMGFVDGSLGGDCFSFSELDLIIDMNCNPNKIIVKDEEDRTVPVVDAKIESDRIYFKPGNSNDEFYTFYCSDSFPENSLVGGCTALTEDQYTIGIINIREYFAVSDLQNFEDSYNSDYENLKTSLGLSQNNDFHFIVTDLEGKEIVKGEKFQQIPTGIDVLSQTYSLDIYKYNTSPQKNIEFKNGILQITIW